jgi:hypothetical protein
MKEKRPLSKRNDNFIRTAIGWTTESTLSSPCPVIGQENPSLECSITSAQEVCVFSRSHSRRYTSWLHHQYIPFIELDYFTVSVSESQCATALSSWAYLGQPISLRSPYLKSQRRVNKISSIGSIEVYTLVVIPQMAKGQDSMHPCNFPPYHG